MALPQVNTKTAGDCGYIAIYKGKKVEVYAPTKFKAQELAAAYFKAKKSYQVDVYLCETAAGNEVIQVAT